MALRLLVDTSVWLDLAKDHREQPVIAALADLVAGGAIELLVPQLVLDEFGRNKQRVAEDARRSLRTHFRLVREAVSRFGDGASKTETLKRLSEVDHKILVEGEAVNGSIKRIEDLITSAQPITTTAAIKERVTERALANLAPYHRAKNSVGDAILVEIYAAEIGGRPDARHVFLTHNIKDFSEVSGDRRKPHPDLAQLFDGEASSYAVSMLEVLKAIGPDLLADHKFEFYVGEQPRRLSEILEVEHLLFSQVWYNRHWNLRTEIENGAHHVVAEKDYSRGPHRSDQILDTVWERAPAAAKRTEEEVGLKNLRPWDDFEWGMINGKLSALRWILGGEWDMLDT